jgi:hypothetical protein
MVKVRTFFAYSSISEVLTSDSFMRDCAERAGLRTRFDYGVGHFGQNAVQY